MKRKKLLFAVNLILIACLVLSPLSVLAQDEAPIPPPEETITEAPAEENGGETVEVSSGGEAVDNTAPPVQNEAPAPVEDSTGGDTTVITDETVNEVKDETPQTDTVDETVTEEKTEAEQPAVINEEGQEAEADESEGGVTDPEAIPEEENKPVEETPGEEAPVEADSSEQPEETVSQPNTVEPAETAPKEIELNLSDGNISITDEEGADGNNVINISVGSEKKQSVANNSTIRVKQNDSATETTNVISIIFTKVKSFINVILEKLNIKTETEAPITVQTDEGSAVALELDGENKVTAAGNAAVHKTGEGELVIQDKNGTAGSLTAENKNAGEYTGTGNSAAAIGGSEGESVGTIVISGATVTASTEDRYGTGAAIGAGKGGSVTKIEITDKANVTATTGRDDEGAAIGGGSNGSVGSIVISGNSKVTATTGTSASGAAIGGGKSGNVGSITITDSEIVNAATKGTGAAIGVGQTGSVDTITISNSKVNATTDGNGAAIGAGSGTIDAGSSVTNIFIEKNSDVTAKSAEAGNGAAIGTGTFGTVENITISDSTVTATGEYYGAAIGGGAMDMQGKGGVKNLTIDNSNVTATGSDNAEAIGVGFLSKDNEVNINVKDVEVVEDDTETLFKTKAAAPTPTPVPVVVVNPPKEDSSDEEVNPVAPVPPKTDTPVEEEEDALVESKKDDDVVQSNVEIEGDTAKITVTDETGEQIEPKEVTIKSVAKFEETGVTEAAIQLTQKLIVNVDVETMKEVSAQTGSETDVVTVTNVDSVITVKSGGAELVSVDVKAVLSATEETVTVKFNRNTVRVICDGTAYEIDMTGLSDLGTLTLKLENGVLKIYDKDGNLLKEVTSA